MYIFSMETEFFAMENCQKGWIYQFYMLTYISLRYKIFFYVRLVLKNTIRTKL